MVNSENWIVISKQDQMMIDDFANMQIERLRSGKRRASKHDPTFLQSKDSILIGYRGEWAVSRWLEIQMDFTTDARVAMGGDLDFGIEVKTTDNPNGNLFCSAKTYADYIKRNLKTPVVLAKTCSWPWVELPGWIFANELPKFPFKRIDIRHNPGFLVPINRLRPMSELKKLCNDWQKVVYLAQKIS